MTERITIRVRKRDGSVEAFDSRKLAAAIWRAATDPDARYRDAWDLAEAIRIYLGRRKMRVVSSAAVFEMTLRVLQRVRMDTTAEAMEQRHFDRAAARKRLTVQSSRGPRPWEKRLLARHGRKWWNLSRSAARLVATEIEWELLPEDGPRSLTLNEALDRVDRRVSELGLADAVPVRG